MAICPPGLSRNLFIAREFVTGAKSGVVQTLRLGSPQSMVIAPTFVANAAELPFDRFTVALDALPVVGPALQSAPAILHMASQSIQAAAELNGLVGGLTYAANARAAAERVFEQGLQTTHAETTRGPLRAGESLKAQAAAYLDERYAEQASGARAPRSERKAFYARTAELNPTLAEGAMPEGEVIRFPEVTTTLRGRNLLKALRSAADDQWDAAPAEETASAASRVADMVSLPSPTGNGSLTVAEPARPAQRQRMAGLESAGGFESMPVRESVGGFESRPALESMGGGQEGLEFMPLGSFTFGEPEPTPVKVASAEAVSSKPVVGSMVDNYMKGFRPPRRK